LRDGGLEEGGLEKLVEFWLRRCWSSLTRLCRFCNRLSYCWIRAKIATCAAGGSWSQSSAGMGGCKLMQLAYKLS
jgi:hypothetical protein